MIRRTLAALLLLLLLPPAVVLACTCLWAGPFARTALKADLVVLAEVHAHRGRRMDVRAIEVLGGSEPRAAITILGGDDANCRAPVRLFPRGTRWLFALRRSSEPRGYALSICGAYWLEVRGDQAVGSITAADDGRSAQSAPLAEVLAWLRSGGATPLPPVTLR